jgi:hypothetical protein
MRLLLIGCNSIGTSRAASLARMGHTVFCTDPDVNRAQWFEKQTGRENCLWVEFDYRHRVEAYDAALVCTRPHARIALALDCLNAGIEGVFIEGPLAMESEGIAALRRAAEGHVVMIGCDLRFASDLPRYRWSLLEFGNLGITRQLKASRNADVRVRSPLELAYQDIDLAYALNGRILALNCERGASTCKISIEHENFAHTVIELDWSECAETPRLAKIVAYDDGKGLHLPHEPECFKFEASEKSQVKEMSHFLECVRKGKQPCNTIDDAEHVFQWAVVASGPDSRCA